MRYRVTIDGTTREVDVSSTGASFSVTLDGAPVDAEITPLPGGLLMKLGNRVIDLAIGGTATAPTLAAGRARALADVESERARQSGRKGGASGKASKELRSPMPGRVVKVLVNAGDEVTADQPLIVIEAMKMENELRAAAAAKVASIGVKPGDAVEGNAVLIRFE